MEKNRIGFFLVVVALVFLCGIANAWDEPTRITVRKGDSVYPQVAAYGSNVYLVWEDATSYPNRDIYFSRSTDEGFSWEEPKRIGWSGKAYEPQLVAYAKKLHVFWLQKDFCSDPYRYGYSIYYIKSINSGNTWSKPIILSRKAFALSFNVFIDKENIHLVWVQDYPTDGYGIYYRRSIDGGISWNKSALVSKSIMGDYSRYIRNPSVCAYKNSVYLVWQDQDSSSQQKLLFKKSANLGKTWTSPVLIKSNPGYIVHYHPDLAISGSNVHLVWDEPAISNSYRIVYKKSINGGKTWTTNKTVYTRPSWLGFSKIGLDNNYVHLVWFNSVNDGVIDYLFSNDKGITWHPKTKIRDLPDYAFSCCYPSIFGYGGKVHIAWMERKNSESDYGYEIYYIKNENNEQDVIERYIAHHQDLEQWLAKLGFKLR